MHLILRVYVKIYVMVWHSIQVSSIHDGMNEILYSHHLCIYHAKRKKKKNETSQVFNILLDLRYFNIIRSSQDQAVSHF